MGRQRSGASETQTTLDEPYPSSPRRPPKFGFILRYEGRYSFINFASLYAAKKEIEAYINGQPFKWITKRQILCDNGLTIQSEQDDGLEKIMDHEYTPLEAEWRIPEPNASNIRRFISQPVNKAMPTAVKTEPLIKPKRPSVEPKPDGLITISQIAQELKLNPREARSMLRALKIPKPAAGWAWDYSNSEKIKDQLRNYTK